MWSMECFVEHFNLVIENSVFADQMESEESKQESEVKNWTEVALVGMPSCVLTERQPTVAPSNQITEAQQYLLIGKSYPEFVFSFEVRQV